MDTIWISNGDKNSRAIVQGRVLLEDPAEAEGMPSIDVTGLPGAITATYTDLSLGAGTLLDGVDPLKFSASKAVPFSIQQDENAPSGKGQDKEGSASDDSATKEDRP